MRIRLAIPDHLVTAQALEAALEATTLANQAAIERGEIPLATEAIDSGVKWKPEPFMDGEHFDLGHQVVPRGWGDCDDLAPWLAAELRATGEDPDARPRVYRSGKNRWHVVTETGDGEILDPSRWAGMGKKSGGSGVSGVGGVTSRPFARPNNGALCVVPYKGQWWARTDLPWPDGSGHIASMSRARTPEDALDRSVAGAMACGVEIESPLVTRCGIAAQLLLAHPEDLYEHEQVGSIFSAIAKPFKSIAKVIKGPAGMILNPALALGTKTLSDKKFAGARAMAANTVIPGSGQFLPEAESMLTKLAHGGGKAKPGVPGSSRGSSGAVSVPIETGDPGHAQHMFIMYHPENAPGPVVMRF